MMKQNRPNYVIGDIVTCSKRRGSHHLYKVVEVIKAQWTFWQGINGYCDPADVGKDYVNSVKLQSFFNLEVKLPTKPRKVGLTCDTYWVDKVEPQDFFEYITRLNQFLADTWP